jgi:hypothetical protein
MTTLNSTATLESSEVPGMCRDAQTFIPCQAFDVVKLRGQMKEKP